MGINIHRDEFFLFFTICRKRYIAFGYKVLDVSRNDYQFENTSLKKISLDSSLSYDDWKIGSFSDLNIAVPNRNPIGETSLHLPVRLTGKSATIVYADHTIVVHDLNPTLSQS